MDKNLFETFEDYKNATQEQRDQYCNECNETQKLILAMSPRFSISHDICKRCDLTFGRDELVALEEKTEDDKELTKAALDAGNEIENNLMKEFGE